MTIPASAHYRPAEGDQTCAACGAYQAGHCTMFDTAVSPSYTCDKWYARQAAAAVQAPSVEHHNRVLRAGERRALELEERLVRILTPILEAAGREAARAFEKHATDHLTAALQEALTAEATPGVTSSSTMVALKPRPDEAAALAHVPGTEPENLHVTLCYIGAYEGSLEDLAQHLRPVAATHAPLEGEVAGIGAFNNLGDGHPGILLPDVPGLVELRQACVTALAAQGVDYSRQHGYTAHLTVAYNDELTFPSRDTYGQPLHFDSILIVRGDTEELEIPLIGVPPLTAATTKPPPQWSAPDPNELIDVPALAARLRTKTDPIRLKVAEQMMGTSLAGVGLAFDAENPLVKKVLAQSASQVTNIAQTTQLNVMRSIRAGYEQGLTIPDTAKLIRAGMVEAAPARARLIARTELVGAVNGGSLAATQLVASVTGDTYTKVWMTAPGAKDPRHEDYDGLDGQEVGLDEYFEVGADMLQFPGDPDGSPEEICNCRCTMSYSTPSGEDTIDAESGGMDIPAATSSPEAEAVA